MASPVRALRTTVLAFAITGSGGCGGELVRLGDGPPDGVGGMADDGGTGRGGAGNGGQGNGGGSAGSAGACVPGQVAANEVLWIGDTWILIPGTQHERVRDHAILARALEAGEDYENRAEPSTFLSDIVGQYEAQQAGQTKVKVLLMDGGTFDTIVADGSAASVMAVASEFEQFLTKVASDGTVEHIVYFLMPELPMIPGVAELRPYLRTACDASTVPCHFLDLQPLWEGNPNYTDGSGIQASEAGATVIADEIWKIMQANCIAQ